MNPHHPSTKFDNKPEPIIHLYDHTPHVDYLFCSSRGSSRNSYNSPKSIYQFLINDLTTNYAPNTAHQLVFDMRGGRQMDNMVSDIITEHYNRGCPSNSHAYIVGGYVDITSRDVDRNYLVKNNYNNSRSYVRYEEVIYGETIEEPILLKA